MIKFELVMLGCRSLVENIFEENYDQTFLDKCTARHAMLYAEECCLWYFGCIYRRSCCSGGRILAGVSMKKLELVVIMGESDFAFIYQLN